MWGEKSDINICIEGLDPSIQGLQQALFNHRDSLQIKNIAASGLGVLAALFLSMNVDPHQVEEFIKGKENKTSLRDIYDEIQIQTREAQINNNLEKLKHFTSKVSKGGDQTWNEQIQQYLKISRIKSQFQKVIEQNSSESLHIQQDNDTIRYEQLINGELAYGQVLVQIAQKFLNKYGNNKNITLREFYDVFKVNFIVSATNLTDRSYVLFTRFSSPDLPVKYACRIAASVPYVFPPIQWQPKWGLFLGRNIDGNMLISGQMKGALISCLIHSSQAFQHQYFGSRIKHEALLCFSSCETQFTFNFTSQFPQTLQLKSECDIWPPFLQQQYLQAVGRSSSFERIKQIKQVTEFDEISGFKLLFQIIDTGIEMQGKVMRELSIGGKAQIISADSITHRSESEINGNSTQEVYQGTKAFLSKIL